MNLTQLRGANRRQTQIICSFCFGCFVFRETAHMNGNHRPTGGMEVVAFSTCFLGFRYSFPEAVFVSVSSIPL